LQELLRVPDGRRPRLFDVGTGVGDFVKLANAHGFDATGNDLSQRGVDLAKERNGLELTTTPVERLPDHAADAVTLWCVLAHVDDPGAFIGHLFRILEPGGVLFLRTPGWSIADRYGFGLARASRGRFAKMAERRMNTAHMFLYNQENMTRHLTDHGFTDVTTQRVCHYSFRTTWYLDKLGGVLGKGLLPVAKAMDALIDRDRFVRNTLFVYARRPDEV
jgi:2-polyprenyl-3-methyl-5-hydroxy-6-metoxy-1,4-benzoquinol methylase